MANASCMSAHRSCNPPDPPQIHQIHRSSVLQVRVNAQFNRMHASDGMNSAQRQILLVVASDCIAMVCRGVCTGCVEGATVGLPSKHAATRSHSIRHGNNYTANRTQPMYVKNMIVLWEQWLYSRCMYYAPPFLRASQASTARIARRGELCSAISYPKVPEYRLMST